MYKEKKIAVVVPVYNEEQLIARVVDTIPAFVDLTIVVDDSSTDRSVDIIESCARGREENLILIRHGKNMGVGAAIVTGYKKAIQEGVDIAVVMAGDAQMDPGDMPRLLDPVADGQVGYAKGNRLLTGQAWEIIPKWRYLGNSFLSLLTKIASGYWHVADSQTGYTAISRNALLSFDLNNIYKRYGMPNDMLVHLNVANCRVRDVLIKPVYNIGERSDMRLHNVMPKLSFLLLQRFLWRIKEKYVIRDFHPLVFFYLLGFLLFAISIPLLIRILVYWIKMGCFPPMASLAWMFAIAIGLQSLFFAMWFDMECNKDLR